MLAREYLASARRAGDTVARTPLPAPPLDTSRPVLIVDSESRADLGLVRSLGFAGIPVHLLLSGRDSVAARSRYVTQTHAFPRTGASDEECVARIRAVARSLRSRPVVLASGDRTLEFLSARRAELADFVDHDLPDPSLIASCLDRERFAEIAARLSLAPGKRNSLDGDMAGRSPCEVTSVHVYMEPAGRVLGLFTCVEPGERPWDPSGCSAVSSHWNERLATLAVDVVCKLRYSGFAVLRFAHDARHDCVRLIEINCRYGAWTELPSRAGCNFPVAAYATITRQSVPLLAQREDVRCWAYFATDDPAPFFWQLLRRSAS
jgi:predicted ATP-grasp superfamily ATP-dependent carboligase